MRILKIRLKNLNSLHEAEVDLTRPPLRHTGLFAITGQTGAGKSTLLDAITLALYGKAARYGTQKPEDMMSRLTGECFAEVEFEVARGRFRASWELRRAHKSSSGTFQPPKRHVYDEDGVTLAQKIREAEVLVEELVGLDYERFMRSVLLAQGEFARFLNAKADERADLLESLTGKTVYSDLGKLAYDKVKEWDTELKTREDLLGSTNLLTPEVLAEKKALIDTLTAERSELATQNTDVGKRVEMGRNLAKALRDNEENKQALAQVAEARAKSASDLERLKLHRAAEPHRESLRRLDSAIKTEQEQAANLTAMTKAVDQANASQALVLAAAVELGELQAGVLLKRLGELDSRVKEQQATKSRISNWLESNNCYATLGQELADIVGDLTRLESARWEVEKQAKLLAAEEAKKAQSQADEQVAAANLKAATQARELTQAKRDEARAHADALLAKGSEDDWQQSVSQLTGRMKELESLLRVHDELARKQAAATALATSEIETKTQADAARKQAEAARSAAMQAGEEVESRRADLGRARAIADLEAQRSLLVDGEACPLCGSLEHPFALHVPDTELSRLEQRLQAGITAWKSAQAGSSAADRELSRLESTVAAKQAQVAELAADIATQQAHIAQTGEQLGLTDVSREHVKTIIESTHKELKEAEGHVTQRRAAAKALGELEKLMYEAQAKEEKTKSLLLRNQDAIAVAAGQIAAHQAGVETAGKTAKNTEAKLLAVLQPYKVSVPESGMEGELRERLYTRRDNYDQSVAKLTECNEELNRAQNDAAMLQAEESALKERIQRLQARYAEMPATERATDAGAVHAKRLSWQNLSAAEDEVESVISHAHVAHDRVSGAQALLAKAQEATGVAQTTLNSDLASSDFANVDALRAALMSDADVELITKREQRLRSEEDKLKGARETYQRTIETLRFEGAVEGEELTLLEAQLQQLASKREELVIALTTLSGELERDAKARITHEAEVRSIAKERERLKVWRQLRGLIGSADGKVFRTFAQGISLAILTRHANQHLKNLSDRYAVRRVDDTEKPLDLEIVDNYQAGATRPTASLSGGETFLVSLALALALADLAGRNVQIDSLFIDEGFGALDNDTLDVALAALDALQMNNKTIGVISHLSLLKERIGVQISVEPDTNGVSRVVVPYED